MSDLPRFALAKVLLFLITIPFARQAPRSGAGNVAGGKREARNPR